MNICSGWICRVYHILRRTDFGATLISTSDPLNEVHQSSDGIHNVVAIQRSAVCVARFNTGAANCVAESVEFFFVETSEALRPHELREAFNRLSAPLPHKLQKPLFPIMSSLLDQLTGVLIALVFLS